MPYKIAVILDKSRIERIRGTPVENEVKDLYGGYLKVIELTVPDEIAQRILKEFPRARIDARGFIEETPVVFKRELFEVIVQLKSTGPEVFSELLKPNRLSRIKEAAAKEDEYLPPPNVAYCG
ncbi:MAG: hypothetical protein RXO26_05415 [Caldivirga sp.]|jgi:hypothetical protein|uniref:DUF6955 family protein n=1 Tax=Caldivirga sp. MU80 TaxID=1650354 RepID=UPI00074853D1|nr:hypothetical protein [Caldivirga sp. MU80]KUO85263.1 MAG: hypothetical protein AT709_06415 [Caldivirga sp. MG_3]NAZ28191.1 hypothetical protein [Caldivirga sp.]